MRTRQSCSASSPASSPTHSPCSLQLVITEGDDVLRKPALLDTSALALCNHEEVNGRTMLHAAHAAYKTILIRTVDTDVVLAMALAGTLKEEIEAWVSISTGKSFRISAGHEIARALGPEKAQALPMFDALTRSPASTDMDRRQHGQCAGQLYPS